MAMRCIQSQHWGIVVEICRDRFIPSDRPLAYLCVERARTAVCSVRSPYLSAFTDEYNYYTCLYICFVCPHSTFRPRSLDQCVARPLLGASQVCHAVNLNGLPGKPTTSHAKGILFSGENCSYFFVFFCIFASPSVDSDSDNCCTQRSSNEQNRKIGHVLFRV